MHSNKGNNFNLMNKIGEVDIELDNYLQESKLIMDSWEKNNEKYLMQKYKNYHSVIQTFLKFYLMSINLSIYRTKESWTEKEAMLTGISTINFWRFRASYLLFKKGYPVESICLLRGIYENILTITALLRNILDIKNIFSEISPTIDLSDKNLVKKKLKDGTFKLSKKVKENIIGKKSPLSLETQNFFNTIFEIMHDSVHRSMINIVRFVFPWYQGKKVLFPLPLFEDAFLIVNMDLSLDLAWIIINFLPKIYEKGINEIKLFRDSYNLMNKSFIQILNNNKCKKFIEEFIQSIQYKL